MLTGVASQGREQHSEAERSSETRPGGCIAIQTGGAQRAFENPWMPGGGGSRYVLGYLRHGHTCRDLRSPLTSIYSYAILVTLVVICNDLCEWTVSGRAAGDRVEVGVWTDGVS